MCGIAGVYGDCSSSLLSHMLERIAHRGPDNLSMASATPLHLAHSRLSIIDLSPESNQPLWDATNTVCIAFNGEIYNYQDLRESLVSQGHSFASGGDAEVIANMYLRYGTKSFSMLQGIFAIAIWDARSDELFVVRDPYGVKPLYYTKEETGFFAFASEMKALLAIPDISRSLCYDALLRSIVFLWSPGPETVLKNIHKLEPGHYLRVKDQKLCDKVMYSQSPQYMPERRAVKKHIDELETCLQSSVEEELVADVPVGAFLSGGLDSSLIVAMASQIYTKPLECFTINSTSDSSQNDGFTDDLPYAKAVAKHLGVSLNVVEAKPDIMKYLSWMIYHLDEPQADPAPLNVSLICKMAREKGIKVLFSGAGGDDVFSGYRRHYAIKLEKYWSWLPQNARRLLKGTTARLPKSNPRLRRLSKMFAYADVSSNERLLSYFYWIRPERVHSLFTEEVKAQLSANPMASLLDEVSKLPIKDPLEQMLYLERKYFLVDHNFNYTDKMSMAHGVEVRVPFLNKRVIECASKIPVKLKQRGRQGKWVLKKVAERYLPKSIIYRSKTGFGAPLRQWLQHDLKAIVDELLGKESLHKRGIFKYEAVQSLIDADREGLEDYSYPIFSLLCIEVWCRIFIDGDKIYEQFPQSVEAEHLEEFV